MRKTIGLFVVFTLFSQKFVKCDVTKSLFKPCRLSDPELNNCLKKTAQQLVGSFNSGIPALKLDPFDPHPINDIASNDENALKFSFSNNVHYGSNNIKIKGLRIDPQRKKIFLTYNSVEYMISDYKLNGNFILFPVTGNGKSNMSLDETEYKYEMDYDVVKGKDGKDHWKIVKNQSTFSPSRVHFDFQNLFNGNKQLGDIVHRFANENWSLLYQEFGLPTMNELSRAVVKRIGKFFAAIPLDEMILP